MNFLFEEPFKIFTYANIILTLFFIVELFLVVMGGSISKAFDKNMDINKGADMSTDSDSFNFSKDAGLHVNYDVNFFQIGKVPFLIVILSLLVGFSTLGYGIHFIVKNILDIYLSNYIVVPLSTVGSIGLTILITKLLTNVLKVEETYAVKNDDLIGYKGIMLPGQMTNTNAVQVKIKNDHGEYHYVLCNTILIGEVCNSGDEVIVLKKNNSSGFYVTKSIEKSKEING